MQKESSREEVCFEKNREEKEQGRMEVGKYLEPDESTEGST